MGSIDSLANSKDGVCRRFSSTQQRTVFNIIDPEIPGQHNAALPCAIGPYIIEELCSWVMTSRRVFR